tara:strand:+ start:27 stop:1193 length:1167 start_codon:yes stop_codon:yes gene_type:complete
MSENKFYVPSHRADPFDFKRGDLFNRDIEWLLYDNVEKLSKNTIVDPNCNNFLICNYLDIGSFKFEEEIPLNKDIKDFCKKNNIKIIVSFSREVIHPRKTVYSDDWYWMFNTDNSNEGCIGFSFFDHAYAINRWRKNRYYNTVEKTKKFSIVLGQVKQDSRLWWCVKLIHDNLHTHPDILFSKVMQNGNKAAHLDLKDRTKFSKDIFKKRLMNAFDENYKETDLYPTFIKHKDYIIENTFIEKDMDLKRLYVEGEEWKIPDAISGTLINIVFETRPHDWAYGSLTEKMWKPIMSGMPFIWVSFRNTKSYLEKKGYKFYNFINYAFDSVERDSQRYRAVYEEFKRLNAFSFDELKAMVDNEKHIAEHNKKVFYGIDYDKRLMNVFSSIK